MGPGASVLLALTLVTPGLTQDYRNFLLNRFPDYYGQVPDVPYPDGPDYVDYQQQPVQQQEQHGPVNDDYNQRLNFPSLTPKQKQFAVNPGLEEFRAAEPDFLQYRLEELDEAEAGNPALEEELQAILGGAQPEEGPPAPADKRGLLGGPRADPLVEESYMQENSDDFLFTSIVAGAAAASVFIVIGAGFCYHKAYMSSKSEEDVEYPAYGVTGPAKDCSPAGDRKLAHSAQMYHYQHQKNQMIAINRTNGAAGQLQEESEGEMEGEGEEGDYTVYECPGLASTDEMEVKNPLFNDDPTPKVQ